MKLLRLRYASVLITIISASCSSPQSEDAVDFVNPFIGTGGHGHTFPGSTAPFGMVQLSPDTRLEGWDGCSGYHYSDEYIYGFSHTHLSGTGVPDYCDILFMPFTGAVLFNNGADGNPGYRSHFSHAEETASPGYYKVVLENSGVLAELTATVRAGMQRYRYPDGQNQRLLVDLKHRDQVTGSWLKVVNDSLIVGYRGSTGWARDQRVYFATRFSKPFNQHEFALNDSIISDSGYISGLNVKAWFDFGSDTGEPLLIKTGISAISADNALMNLDTEIRGWNFDQVKDSTRADWNRELNKIKVEGKDADKKTVFYTALYHSMICPNTFSDVDGTYLGRDFRPHTISKGNYYTVFSLWDTYRALHPLLTLIDQKRTNEFIGTFIHQYKDGGMLPVWELSANETWCMIGYHAVPVIADAWSKGIRDYDGHEALSAMVNSASQNHFGLEYYRNLGYIPAEMEHESVSKTLEYAYDDWCIASMAASFGMDSLRDAFNLRAQSYKNLYDQSDGFMKARYNGGWFTPFDPAEVNFNYTEANSWQYSFSVPQDMDGFIRLHGGQGKSSAFLDSLFSALPVTTGRDQSDITGLIGQYAHGNEPSHHIAYLYDYFGQPWKTQAMVSRILKDFYTNSPDGLIGNEDCGQMSAWCVFSSAGFYPVCPGSGQYALGSPAFSRVQFNLENGKQFTVIAEKLSDKNIYIRKASLNGHDFKRSYINHNEIMAGGELRLEMGPEPAKDFGRGPENEPRTGIEGRQILPAPVAGPSARVFRDSTEISLRALSGATLVYTLDGSMPDERSPVYSSPIQLNRSTTLRFNAFLPGFIQGHPQKSEFTKMPEGLEIISVSDFAPQYSGTGKINLIDGLKGSNDFRLGGWQGFEGKNMEAVVHLVNNKPVHSISLGCLQDINSWIFYPATVEVWESADGITFKKTSGLQNNFPAEKWGTFTREFTFNHLNITNRFIKVIADYPGPCPAWHPGHGNPAWMFFDELTFGY